MFFTYQFLSERNNILSNVYLLIIIITLFAVLINDNAVIQKIGPNLIFIAMVIILHSVFYHLFHKEFSDGIIEQILLQPISIELFLTKRILYTSLFYQISILLVMPLLTILTNINSDVAYRLTLALLCSIPIIITLSSVGGALSIRKNHNSIIMSIIILPLLVPASILGSSVAYSMGEYKELLALFMLIVLTLPINVIAISYLLKIAVRNE